MRATSRWTTRWTPSSSVRCCSIRCASTLRSLPWRSPAVCSCSSSSRGPDAPSEIGGLRAGLLHRRSVAARYGARLRCARCRGDRRGSVPVLQVHGDRTRHPRSEGYALDSFIVGPLLLDTVRVYAALAAVAIAGGLFLFFKFTGTGRAIRACADNYLGAKVVGLNVKKYYALTFGIGSACVGAAGCLMVLLVDVTPLLGPGYTLLAFIIVIVGGLGSMPGALLGGVLIGVSEALAGLL